MEKLLIHWDKEMVGTLFPHKRGRVQFQYSQKWLETQGRPISLSLPCQSEKHAPGISTAFFENLLPENNARSILAFNHRFDKKDTFAFLGHFGEDCAGALSILPDNQTPDFTPGQYEDITELLVEALDRIKADPEKHQLFPEMKKARLSIAGAQDKLPVHIDKNQFYLPANSGSATSHIIKPASLYYPDIQKNEAFCMELALQAGLAVPCSQLLNIDGHDVFAIERYDRIQSEKGLVIRIHQEDFCQAQGIPANRKYQEKGGPGFIQCRQLTDEYLSLQGAEPRMNLVRVTLFNYLIGNHDAHGKNFSIIHGKDMTMAPFYDLLSTQVYPGLENKFAMSIGKTFRHDRIGEGAFRLFAGDMKLRLRKFSDLMDTMIQMVSKCHEPLLSSHEKKYGASGIYQSLSLQIKKNIELLSRVRDAL